MYFRIVFATCCAFSLMRTVALANEPQTNLLKANDSTEIVIVLSKTADPLEQYAAEELTSHLEKVTGTQPRTVLSPSDNHSILSAGTHVVVVGSLQDSSLLKHLAEKEFFEPNSDEQGFAIAINTSPFATKGNPWLVALAGADPRGTLYAVRDFCHYYCFQQNEEAFLLETKLSFAPPIKVRQLSESGCNLFTATNPESEFMNLVHLNVFSQDVVFNKQHFVDWLSEWKINQVTLVWCNFKEYEKAYGDFIEYAHSRGIKVFAFYVPYRPAHEGAPTEISEVPPGSDKSDCPRDPAARKWYVQRLKELVNMEPQLDGIVIESPYHDGVSCKCDQCKASSYPEDLMLKEMFAVVREHRPEMPISLCLKHRFSDKSNARRFAAQLTKLEGESDFYINSVTDRDSRRYWFSLGPKHGSYLRPYRQVLKSTSFAAEIGRLYQHFRDSAQRNVMAHGFCYRFYAGRMGSYNVKLDNQMREQYPDRKGAFSMALVAEAAFDPMLDAQKRAKKIKRIYDLTIPDYPREKELTSEDWSQLGIKTAPSISQTSLHLADPAASTPPSRLLKTQYSIEDPSFVIAQICADLSNDGTRTIVCSSRGTATTHLIRASDGAALWSNKIPGQHQSLMAHDLDDDGNHEIIYTTSGPGRIHLLDHATGKVLKQWDTGDWKAGDSPVIVDGDGDGILDGYFGTRSKFLVRLNLKDMSLIKSRSPWAQCGCHTSALDVDQDGRWDLFAGSGDDSQSKGSIHRFDPVSLKSLWFYDTNDNASSADMVLADIDADGEVEIIKSVDNYAGDDAHDAIYAFETDGTLLWKVPGFSGEDSPNVADLDGDGQVEIVGMTFGSEVYCLDGQGKLKWRRDLRPELDDSAHAYMTPILCDLDGDQQLEILALTNDRFFQTEEEAKDKQNGILFVLDAEGNILDQYDMGSPRYWGTAFVCNVDNDPYLELIASGSGGIDVIETKGMGPNTEHFQRRRTYQRLNVVPWAYEDTYFNHRGNKQAVKCLTDNLVLEKSDKGYRPSGTFTTELLTLPPETFFDSIELHTDTPEGTSLKLNILNQAGELLAGKITESQELKINQPVRLQFVFESSDPSKTPLLDSYRLTFREDE